LHEEGDVCESVRERGFVDEVTFEVERMGGGSAENLGRELCWIPGRTGEVEGGIEVHFEAPNSFDPMFFFDQFELVVKGGDPLSRDGDVVARKLTKEWLSRAEGASIEDFVVEEPDDLVAGFGIVFSTPFHFVRG
jgi:hypothetical protein